MRNLSISTNGIYALKSKQVVNAGEDFVKAQDQKGFIIGNQDRRQKDKKFSRAYVVINQGAYKGLKARVFFADENNVKVEIQAKDLKIVLPRTHVCEFKDPTKPL